MGEDGSKKEEIQEVGNQEEDAQRKEEARPIVEELERLLEKVGLEGGRRAEGDKRRGPNQREAEAGQAESKKEEKILPPGWEWIWMENTWTK